MNILKLLFLPAVFVLGASFVPGSAVSFEETQKSFPRVKEAYERKEEYFLMKCRAKDIPDAFSNMMIRVFKEEGQMEIWAQNNEGKYVLFNVCKVYAMSGDLGPKRKQGDNQVPEGFYYINTFNPYSNYHLSLKINYPNESDNRLSIYPNKGGDIFIHGAMVSAGCMAMSNYYIEDIYITAVKARNQGQEKIPVQVFPFRMTEQNIQAHMAYPQYKPHATFWRNLAEGYNYFESAKRPAEVSVDAYGKYHFSAPANIKAARSPN